MEQYYRDKLSACSQPGAELTVANADSDLLTERVALLGPRVEWVSADDDPGVSGSDWMEPLGLPGRHNRRNALIARRCLIAMGVPGAADDARLRAAAAGYQPLPSRLASIGTVSGVTFVDDSLSTNVLPTLAALDSFPGRRIALIVGGHDRGIDYAPLAAGIVARPAPTYVVTLPDSGPRIRAEIDQAALDQAALDQAALDQAALDQAALDQAALDQAALDQAALDQAAAPSVRSGPALRGCNRPPGPGVCGGGGVPVGQAGWRGPAVAGRAQLRPVPRLPRSRRSLRPRHARDFVVA